MARPVRIEYPGAVYHVITRGNNGQRIFKEDHDRRMYLEKLFSYCELKEVELVCYCLLSNHIHLLVATPRGNLSKFMQPFQTSYTVYFNKKHGRTGHVFEQRYKALLVDRDNYLLQVSRYIHLNPVEAGLASRPQDYRWSSYREYIQQGRREMGGVRKEAIFEQLGGKGTERVKRYREYVEGEKRKDSREIRFPVVRQAIVGEEEFAESVLREGRRRAARQGVYTLGEITDGVCRVMKVTRENLGRPLRDPRVQRARELLMYLGRRYSEADLREIANRLGLRDISSVSHGVRRVEEGLRRKGESAREFEQVLKKVHSSIQA